MNINQHACAIYINTLDMNSNPWVGPGRNNISNVSNEPGGVVHAVVEFDGALQSALLEAVVKHARTVIL